MNRWCPFESCENRAAYYCPCAYSGLMCAVHISTHVTSALGQAHAPFPLEISALSEENNIKVQTSLEVLTESYNTTISALLREMSERKSDIQRQLLEIERNYREKLERLGESFNSIRDFFELLLTEGASNVQSECEISLNFDNIDLDSVYIELFRKGFNSSPIAQSLQKMIDGLNSVTQYNDRLKLSLSLLEMNQRLHGHRSIEAGTAYHTLGLAQRHTKNFDEAIQSFNMSIEITKEQLGEEHKKIAYSLHHLGNCYYETKVYDKAIQYFQESLLMKRKTLKRNTESEADTLNNLGNAYRNSKDYAKAFEMHDESIRIKTQLFGADSLKLTNTYFNIAKTHESVKNYEQALSYYNKSLEIRNRNNDFEPAIKTLWEIGNVLRIKKKYQQSIDIYHEALEKCRNQYGNNHNLTGITLFKLGFTLDVARRHEDSLQCYSECLQIKREVLGPEHLEIGTVHYSISKTLIRLNRNDQALEEANNCLQILRIHYNEGDPRLDSVLKTIEDFSNSS